MEVPANNTEIRPMRDDLEAEEEICEELRLENCALQTQIGALQSELNQYMQQIASLTGSVSQLRAKENALNEQLDAETLRADGLDVLTENQALEVVRLRDEVDTLRRTIEGESPNHSNSNSGEGREAGRQRSTSFLPYLVSFNPSIRTAPDFNAAADVAQLQRLIAATTDDKADKGALKVKLATLLSARSAKQRGLIAQKYHALPDELLKDITAKLKKGHGVALCAALLHESMAAFDASTIHSAQANGDLNAIGDVLCTRNNKEISRIVAAYAHKFHGSDLAKVVRDLCEKNKRGSVRVILDSLLKRVRDERASVDLARVTKDVEFLLTNSKFKSEQKRRLVAMFCDENWRHIRELNRQYGMRSRGGNLEKLLSKQLGSGSAYLSTVLLKYSCDPTEYTTQRLFELGHKFDKNRAEIARIFVSRSESDLNEIRARFAKTQYGKQLDAWLEDKSKHSNFARMLVQILTSFDRHSARVNAHLSPKHTARRMSRSVSLAVPLIVRHIDASVPSTPQSISFTDSKFERDCLHI